MAISFRFLHASDLHLDQPPGGLTDVPDELIEPLLDAPYQAFAGMVDAALREHVDFVVLTGDVIHFPSASPKAIDCLTAQFERLHKQHVPVYWLGGRLEAGQTLPSNLKLPDNVTRIGGSRVQKIEVKRDKKTVAHIVGQSVGKHAATKLETMRVPRDGRFFVGLWYNPGKSDPDRDLLDDLGIDYWALGGRHDRRSLDTMIPAEYCGTPQGRLPSEEGPHGCTLVKVDRGRISSHFIETDTVRYHHERVELHADADRAALQQRLRQQLLALENAVASNSVRQLRHTLISWRVVHDGSLGKELRRGETRDELLAQLQRDLHDAGRSRWWTVDLQSQRSAISPELFDEDSILGDFLRVVREMEQSQDPLLALHQVLPETGAAAELRENLHLNDRALRTRLLRDVTEMGVDMLSGGQT